MFGNAKVLAVALGLAAVVVILYNVHVNAIRNEIKSNVVQLPSYNKTKNKGDVLKKSDVDWVAVPTSAAKGFKNVMTTESQLTEFYDQKNRPLTRGVQAGKWIEGDDFITSDDRGRSVTDDQNVVLITVPLDQKEVMGRSLAVDTRVNLLARFMTAKGNYDLLPIIDGVLVREVSQRSILVEIPIKIDPDQKIKLSTQVRNALSHAQGGTAVLELRSRLTMSGDLVLHDEVKKFASTAMPAISEAPGGGGVVPPVNIGPP